jgi:hypothetical protein
MATKISPFELRQGITNVEKFDDEDIDIFDSPQAFAEMVGEILGIES